MWDSWLSEEERGCEKGERMIMIRGDKYVRIIEGREGGSEA